MPYEIVIDPKAAREIRALPQQDQRRIIARAQALGNNPRPPGCVKLAGGTDFWRIRVGVYRIIYQIQDKRLLITVIRVGHRRDVYREI